MFFYSRGIHCFKWLKFHFSELENSRLFTECLLSAYRLDYIFRSIDVFFYLLFAKFNFYHLFVFIFQFIFLSSEIIRYINGNFSFSVLLRKFFLHIFLCCSGSGQSRVLSCRRSKGRSLTTTHFQIDHQKKEIFRCIHYLAPKIPGIFAEKLDRNVSVYRRYRKA